MITEVSKYIEEQKLFSTEDRILIGISGGRDSMSLCFALKDLGYQIALAHCNFSLRGKESDADEQFVLNFAKENKLEVFNIKFDTQAYASKNSISIQMAARELRYNWFEEIRKTNNYNYIAIAHNRDDIVETYFINLIRGTGIEGLTGIKAKNDKIVRPLLDISREKIDSYITENNISYREDSSNASTKYIRNKLRHQILPELRSISKVFDQTMVENIDRINQVNQVYKNEISFQKSKTLIQLSDSIKINIQKLKNLTPTYTYLYEFLKPYGFTASTISDIEQSLNAESGKKFLSKTHQIIKDREYLILTEINTKPTLEIFFDKETKAISNPVPLKIEIIDKVDYKMSKSNLIMALDIEKLSFPLLIRNWKQGDYFMPLGMNRMKKLSNFFIDSKVSITEKNKTFIIQSKNDIVAIVGKRIDDRYKITNETKQILKITLKTGKDSITI